MGKPREAGPNGNVIACSGDVTKFHDSFMVSRPIEATLRSSSIGKENAEGNAHEKNKSYG